MSLERLNETLLGIMLPVSFLAVVLSVVHFTYTVSPVHTVIIFGSYTIHNLVKYMAEKVIAKKQQAMVLEMLRNYNEGENK